MINYTNSQKQYNYCRVHYDYQAPNVCIRTILINLGCHEPNACILSSRVVRHRSTFVLNSLLWLQAYDHSPNGTNHYSTSTQNFWGIYLCYGEGGSANPESCMDTRWSSIETSCYVKSCSGISLRNVGAVVQDLVWFQFQCCFPSSMMG